MKAFVRRVAIFLLTIWFSATLIWLIPRLAPGDPVSAIIDRMAAQAGYVENADQIVAGWRERFGLDDPLHVQYMRYLFNLLRFDFGYSLAAFPTPVSDIIGRALPWTLGLALTANLITFFLGNAIGALLAWQGTPRVVKALFSLPLLFTAVPSVLAGIFLIYVFAFTLNWFPITGAYGRSLTPDGSPQFIASVIHHAVLPVSAIVLVNLGYWALSMRGMLTTLYGEDYLQLARAKGLRAGYLLYRYMVRNAMLPQITALTFTLAGMLGGQILVESVFVYYGMGTVIYNAIRSQDYPVIQASSVILIVVTAIAAFIIDLLYPLIDPRIEQR